LPIVLDSSTTFAAVAGKPIQTAMSKRGLKIFNILFTVL